MGIINNENEERVYMMDEAKKIVQDHWQKNPCGTGSGKEQGWSKDMIV